MFNPNAERHECPYCGSEDLYYGSDIYDDDIFEEVTCNECGVKFYSKFVFSGHVERVYS